MLRPGQCRCHATAGPQVPPSLPVPVPVPVAPLPLAPLALTLPPLPPLPPPVRIAPELPAVLPEPLALPPMLSPPPMLSLSLSPMLSLPPNPMLFLPASQWRLERAPPPPPPPPLSSSESRAPSAGRQPTELQPHSRGRWQSDRALLRDLRSRDHELETVRSPCCFCAHLALLRQRIDARREEVEELQLLLRAM